MNVRRTLGVLYVGLLGAGTAFAQDPVKVDPAHYKVILDNPTVRVLKISYPAGSKSVMHQHPDAIVVALAPAKVRFGMPDGTSQDSDMVNNGAMYTPAGKHLPNNVGTNAVDAILVEFKAPKPGTATVPTSRPNMAVKTLADGPYGTAILSTADPTFHEAAGTKHDYDQVVIALEDSAISLSLDGKAPKTSWKRGDVQFIGRGTPHESKNLGSKPVEFVIVAIK